MPLYHVGQLIDTLRRPLAVLMTPASERDCTQVRVLAGLRFLALACLMPHHFTVSLLSLCYHIVVTAYDLMMTEEGREYKLEDGELHALFVQLERLDKGR